MRYIVLLRAIVASAALPLGITQAAAQTTPALYSDIGVARVDSTNGCLAIHRAGIAEGTSITLVQIQPASRDSAVAIVAQVRGSATRGSAPCTVEFGEEGDQFYKLSLSNRALSRGAYFALLAPRPAVSLGAGVAQVTLGTGGRILKLQSCLSTEGLHLTAWNGEVLKGQRTFHAYYYLGYDVVPTCTAAETSAVSGTQNASVAQPDSAAEHFFLKAVLTAAENHFVQTAADTGLRILRIRFPVSDEAHWSRYSDFLMQQLHARPVTDTDDRANDLGIHRLVISGDTLIGHFDVGERRRCATGQWTGGAGLYQMRAIREAGGWSMLLTRTVGAADSRRCPKLPGNGATLFTTRFEDWITHSAAR